jgi:broad specificity phosphatase PhoE
LLKAAIGAAYSKLETITMSDIAAAALRESIVEAATAAGILDPILANLIPSPDNDDGVQDAVHEYKAEHPNLFREIDFGKMDSARFKEAEEELLSAGRQKKSADSPPDPYKALDAAQLSDAALKELQRHMGGNRNAVDYGILNRALREQQS